jgi:hypothetical protein
MYLQGVSPDADIVHVIQNPTMALHMGSAIGAQAHLTFVKK